MIFWPLNRRARLPSSSALKICARLTHRGMPIATTLPTIGLSTRRSTQLSAYYERGLRIANLSYNPSSFFGGGCLDPMTPLSRAGRYIVGQMQEMGILVDCSHSSEQTSLDIVRMATRPVVCSHSNPVAIDDNPRNVSDRLIEGIAKTGGLIGVNPINCFLLWSREDAPHADTGPFPPLASISQYVDMMDYVRRLVGIDYIGIGSDWTIGNPRRPDVPPVPSAKSFTYPPEMIYNQPANPVRREFQPSSSPPSPPSGTEASRLFFRRHSENFGGQLDARVPPSLELLIWSGPSCWRQPSRVLPPRF